MAFFTDICCNDSQKQLVSVLIKLYRKDIIKVNILFELKEKVARYVFLWKEN